MSYVNWFDWFKIKWRMRNKINEFLLRLIKKVNPHKSRVLSQKLFELAEKYNTRPGEMNYHDLDGNYIGDHES